MTAPKSTVAVRERIIALAESQIGVNESPAYSNITPYSKWYGITGPWCAMFVSWVLAHAGFPLKISTDKGFAYCPSGVDWFKRQGAWASSSVKPQRGWIVFFDFIGRPSHTGIVAGIAADGRIITIEGNTNAAGSRTGGSVMRHYRSAHSGGIIGYGIINYVAPISVAKKTSFRPTRTLRYASPMMVGADVKNLQSVLIGFHKLPLHHDDGKFGRETEGALKAWQRQLHITDDGIYGPITQRKTAEVLAYIAAVSARK